MSRALLFSWKPLQGSVGQAGGQARERTDLPTAQPGISFTWALLLPVLLG